METVDVKKLKKFPTSALVKKFQVATGEEKHEIHEILKSRGINPEDKAVAAFIPSEESNWKTPKDNKKTPVQEVKEVDESEVVKEETTIEPTSEDVKVIQTTHIKDNKKAHVPSKEKTDKKAVEMKDELSDYPQYKTGVEVIFVPFKQETAVKGTLSRIYKCKYTGYVYTVIKVDKKSFLKRANTIKLAE